MGLTFLHGTFDSCATAHGIALFQASLLYFGSTMAQVTTLSSLNKCGSFFNLLTEIMARVGKDWGGQNGQATKNWGREMHSRGVLSGNEKSTERRDIRKRENSAAYHRGEGEKVSVICRCKDSTSLMGLWDFIQNTGNLDIPGYYGNCSTVNPKM